MADPDLAIACAGIVFALRREVARSDGRRQGRSGREYPPARKGSHVRPPRCSFRSCGVCPTSIRWCGFSIPLLEARVCSATILQHADRESSVNRGEVERPWLGFLFDRVPYYTILMAAPSPP